jgi:adenylate cyclase
MYLSPFMPMLTPVLIMTMLSLLKYGIEARKVRQRTLDLVEAQDTIIFSMSALTETRDKETGGHIKRTRRYVETLARQLATMPRYHELDELTIELLAKSAPLHDIGKVGIPDSILHKPGELSEQEYEIMKSHTLIGVHALTRTIGGTEHPEQHDFLHFARQMIEAHHERWDGSGYPHGLRGEEIPLAGRLMALADAYDAMVSRRVYKQEYPHEEALEIIRKNAGKLFDPDVVTAFLARKEDFLRIAHECSEESDAAIMAATEDCSTPGGTRVSDTGASNS